MRAREASADWRLDIVSSIIFRGEVDREGLLRDSPVVVLLRSSAYTSAVLF